MSSYDDEVVAVATGAGATIEVAGEGPLATRLRERFAGSEPAAGAEPEVVVVAAHGDDALAAALGRVANLGTVILAGAPEQPTVAIDLYADLHSRAITLIGMTGG